MLKDENTWLITHFCSVSFLYTAFNVPVPHIQSTIKCQSSLSGPTSSPATLQFLLPNQPSVSECHMVIFSLYSAMWSSPFWQQGPTFQQLLRRPAYHLLGQFRQMINASTLHCNTATHQLLGGQTWSFKKKCQHHKFGIVICGVLSQGWSCWHGSVL